MFIERFLASYPSLYGYPPLNILKECYMYGRLDRRVTKLVGPLFKPSRKRIAIDLTYNCNLKCPSCCRSCSQAPADEYISIPQIEKFIKESLELDKKWERIDLIGGEPTLHPQFLEILDMVHSYKTDHSPKTQVRLRSNARGERYEAVAKKLPEDVKVHNQPKNAEFFKRSYYAFNVAPIDLPKLKRIDPANGCYMTSTCGIGLNKYGYYICGNGAGIDRIFGFDIGRKKIPSPDDDMRDQMRILCSYCGAFHRCFEIIRMGKPSDNFAVSKTWEAAYEKYKKKPPPLTLY